MNDVEHKPGCPRLQFWAAGELEAPCWCGEAESDVAALQNEINEYWMVKVNELITERDNAEQKAADWRKWCNTACRERDDARAKVERLRARVKELEAESDEDQISYLETRVAELEKTGACAFCSVPLNDEEENVWLAQGDCQGFCTSEHLEQWQQARKDTRGT